MPSEARQKKIMEKLNRAQKMLNFGASKPRVKGGARAPGAPPGSAPEYLGRTNQVYSINMYHESKDNQKFIASSSSVHIYNAQTKGTQHKSMVEPAHERRGLHLLVNS